MPKAVDAKLLGDAVTYIEQWVAFRQETLRVPGVQVAVAHDGRLLLSRAYGMANVETATPLSPSHMFRIASHSKTFTATAIMRLVEAGSLRLDDRAGDLLDWLPRGPGQLGRTTVRQLLSHSAGVIRDGETGGWWQLERDFPSADQLLREFSATPPVFAENLQFKYSNYGFSLLGMIVERVSGRPYNEFVTTEIVQRLGLGATGPEIDSRAGAGLATGYSIEYPGLGRLPLAHMDTHGMSAATGFYSTAEDLCRYAQAHFLGNEELLSDESKREMQREHWRVDGVPMSYGLGFVIASVGERRTIGHSGGFPGFITNTKLDPVERIVVVALTNAGDGPAADLTSGMFQIINRALGARPAEKPTDDLDALVGRYWSIGGAIDIARFGSELLAISPMVPNPLDPVTELEVTEEGATIVKAPGFASPGESVRFDRDEDGGVRKMSWAGSAFYPWERFGGVLAAVKTTGRSPGAEPERAPA